MPTPPSTERRQSLRRKPSQLVYVEFGRENGGMVKNVSEGGLRFSLMHRVTAGQDLHFGITIDPTRRIEGQARIVWTDASGKSGGMAFAEMPAESRATLHAWLADIDAPPQAVPAPPIQPPAPANVPASVPDNLPVDMSVNIPVSVADDTADTASSMRVEMNPPQFAEVAQQMIAQATLSPTVDPLPAQAPPAEPLAPRPAAAQPVPAQLTPPAPPVPAPAAPAPQPRSIASMLLPSAPQPPPAPHAVNMPPPVHEPPAVREPRATQISPTPRAKVQQLEPETASVVSHDDWKRASRESFVEQRTARRSAAVIAEEKRERAAAASRTDKRKLAEIAEHVDPMREFLKHPIGAVGEIEPGDLSSDLPLPVQQITPATPGSRVAMVLGLVAICAVAAIFAAVAYRQTVGESIIKLGEKISGEPRATSSPESLPISPAQNSSALEVPPTSKSKPAPQNDKANTSATHAGETAHPSGNDSAPAAAHPASQTQPQPQPITQSRPPVTQKPLTPQPELASGKEIIPGKPRYQPGDVSALWLAVENGDSTAEVLLANHYVTGEGVAKNCDQARILLQAAAKRGNETAAKRLAELPADGCQ
jgi:hypothetical protein